jgi:hypothetical protein
MLTDIALFLKRTALLLVHKRLWLPTSALAKGQKPNRAAIFHRDYVVTLADILAGILIRECRASD